MSRVSFSNAAQKSCAPGYIFGAALGVGAVRDRVSKSSETSNFYNLPMVSRTNHINRTGWRRVETLVGRCELWGVKWCGVTTQA